MRKTICASLAAAAVFAIGSEAHAQSGNRWGLNSGDTVNRGDMMLYGEVGWPDLSLGMQYGVNDRIDVGARFSVIYGFAYSTHVLMGLGLRAPIRINLAKGPKVSALLRIEPGIKFDSVSLPLFGIQIPIAALVGIHLTPAATLQFGLDLPLNINFTQITYFNIPILVGPGFEYQLDDHMAVGLNSRFGATVIAGSTGFGGGGAIGFSGAQFAMIMQAGFAYRF